VTRLTPVKAIRAKCLDCCCGQRGEVRQCSVCTCSLHPYRLGKRPGESGGEDGLLCENEGASSRFSAPDAPEGEMRNAQHRTIE